MALRLTAPLSLDTIPRPEPPRTLAQLYGLPLDFLPPAPLPPPPPPSRQQSSTLTCSLRDALLSTSRQLDHYQNSSIDDDDDDDKHHHHQKNRYIVPRSFLETLRRGKPDSFDRDHEHDDDDDSEAEEEEEEELSELVWNGARVEWTSLGQGRVKRVWDHSHELGEQVSIARFVHLGGGGRGEPSTRPTAAESSQEEEEKEEQAAVWGPYSTSNQQGGGGGREWSDEVLKLPTEPPKPSSSSSSPPSPRNNRLRPYLLIVFSTLAFLHPLDDDNDDDDDDDKSFSSGGGGRRTRRRRRRRTAGSRTSTCTTRGGGIPIQLPFKISSIHPLLFGSGGVLFERDREGTEVFEQQQQQQEEEEEEEGGERLRKRVPVWWSLGTELDGRGGSPYGQLKPLLVNFPSSSPQREGKGGAGGGRPQSGTVLKDLDERLVFVSNHRFDNNNDRRRSRTNNSGKEEPEPMRVGVSVNEVKGKVTVWKFERTTRSTEEGREGPGKEKGKATDAEGQGEGLSSMNLDISPISTTQKKLTRRSAGGGGGGIADLDLSHFSATTDSNRSALLPTLGTTTGANGRRRSSRLSHAYDLSSSNEVLLSAAASRSHSQTLPPLTPHDLSSSRAFSSLRRTQTTESGGGGGGGANGGNSPENRRTSLTRNDLSVTMDRMALSQGSSVGGGGGGVPGVPTIHSGMLLGGGGGGIETVLDREATVYLGEEEWADKVRNEGEASEWTMTCVWQGDLDGTSAKGIQVDLFDQRSPTIATLSILLPAASTLLLLSLSSEASLAADPNSYNCTPIKQIDAKDACPVIASRPNVQDLVVLDTRGNFSLISAQGTELQVGGLEREEEIVGIESNGGSRVVLVSEQEEQRMRKRRTTSVVFEVARDRNRLGQKVLETLAQVLGNDEFSQLLARIGRGRRRMTGFERVRSTLEEMFGIVGAPGGESTLSKDAGFEAAFINRLRTPTLAACPSSTPITAVRFTSSHFAILLSLHLLVQSLRLRISTLYEAQELAELVVKLASTVGARGWVDEYRRIWGTEVTASGQNPTPSEVGSPTGLLPKTPANIVNHLYNLLACSPTPDSSSFSLSHVAQLFSTGPPSFYYGDESFPLSPLVSLVEIYSLLGPSSATNPTHRAHQAVFRYHELGFTAETLKDLPFGVSMPIREAMRTCQLDPPEVGGDERDDRKWTGFWNLVGRSELERVRDQRETRSLKRPRVPPSTADIDSLAQEVEAVLSTTANAASNEVKENKPDLNPVPRAARFNEDKRMEEVTRMLQYVEPVVIAPGEKTLDQLTPQVQQSILSALSHRTFALPVGAAMYHLASVRQSASDSLEIPKINTAARMVPMPSPVALAEKERDPAVVAVPDRSEWPDFHSGVAAALRLKLDRDKPVDSSQISFNRPAELDARHAGLLLGLGLNRQLGSMLSSQAYDYLKSKHDPTSVAILLGLAVTFLGTSDPTVTSVISIHLPALHPPRSSSLNVSGMTKSAAAVALGFLHFGTGRRSLADVLVREMCGVKVTNVEDASACREAYALSCGFAFGFIMLAKGGKKGSSTSSKEVDLLRVFRALVLGENNRPLPGAFYPASASNAPIDVNITSSAATVGLALMFIRTERQDVADIFEIPDSPRRLDYVRSDLLLLRALGRSFVMWNAVSPSKEWIESNLPQFLAELDLNKPVDSDWEVARWSIVAGVCFAIGFKYAGTATAEAHATLIHYLDRLTRASYVKAMTVQAKIKRASLRTCLGVVAIALGMVMAGTGELNVLRRLRVAHGHFSEGLSYGYHLSTHMALGLLFLGEAKYTLSNSNGAIAALLLALYPVFPSSSTDNRAHLQAYRHLWVLAAEPRYLEARDIDSNEPVFLPVRLRLADQSNGPTNPDSKVEFKAKQLVAPTLIPDVRLVDSIQVESPRYWGFTIRLATNSVQFSRFLRDSTLYVKRRTGHLSYAQDPRGIRSIFTRSKSETGATVYDFGETTRMFNPSAVGLRDFVAAFSDDSEAIESTEQLCVPPDANRPPSEFEAFCASVLLECLTKDKRDVATVYHSMFHAHSLLSPTLAPSTETLFAAEQLRLVVNFYKRGIFRTLFGKPSSSRSRSPSSSSTSSPSSSSGSREPLLNPAFIDHVSSSLSSRIDSPPSHLLSAYLASPGAWPSSPKLSVSLALQLAQHSVPDLAGLEQLERLVRHAKNGEHSQRVDEVALLLRCTASTIETSGKKAWSKEVSRLLSRI